MFFPGGSDYVGIQTKGGDKMNIDSMIQGNPQALVTSYNGVLVADSLEVADRFGKRHTHVLRSIDDLGIGQRQAYELVKSEGFPAKKLGNSYRIPKDDFLDWVKKQ